MFSDFFPTQGRWLWNRILYPKSARHSLFPPLLRSRLMMTHRVLNPPRCGSRRACGGRERREISCGFGAGILLCCCIQAQKRLHSQRVKTLCVRSMRAKSFPEMNCLRNAFVLSRSFPISLSRFPTFLVERYAPGSVSERKDVA